MEMPRCIEGDLQAAGLKFTIVAARFNDFIVEQLLEAAVAELASHGAGPGQVEVIRVPGAYDLPVVVRHVATRRRSDAIIALGAVIRGDTPHFDYVAGECAAGLARAAEDTGVPVAFGVLTTEDAEQAAARAGGRAGNRGADAAQAAIRMARLMRELGD